QPHHRPPPCACPTRRLACQSCPHQRADSPTSSLGSPGTGLQGVGLRPHRQEGGCASLSVFFAALNRGCRPAQKSAPFLKASPTMHTTRAPPVPIAEPTGGKR